MLRQTSDLIYISHIALQGSEMQEVATGLKCCEAEVCKDRTQKFYVNHHPEKVHLEKCYGYERINMKMNISELHCVKVGDGWNWLRTVPSHGPYYQRC